MILSRHPALRAKSVSVRVRPCLSVCPRNPSLASQLRFPLCVLPCHPCNLWFL